MWGGGRICGTSILIQAALVTAAAAADMATKAPPVVPVPIASWTGLYVGANIGGGFTQKTFIDNFPTPDGVIDASPKPAGWVGGFQAGYNYQINSLLLGVEGDFTWLGIRDSFSCFSFGAQICSANPGWTGAIAGRIGAVFGPTLFYVKGGPAWIRDTYSDIATAAGAAGGVVAIPGDLFSGQDIRWGWTVGGGAEYMLTPHWSLRLEYDYMNFGERSVGFSDGAGNFFTELIKQNMQMVTAGVNYHFSAAAAPAPIVTKASGLTSSEGGQFNNINGFSGVDVGKMSVSGWTGALMAPWTDMDTSGPRIWIYGEGGAYKYPGTGGPFKGVYESGDLLGGYGFEGDNYSINALAGLNAINHMVTPFDPDNKVQGTEGGFKVRGDAYTNPTPQTMTYGEAEYSTAFQTYYVSQRVGFDVTNGQQIFVGPQASVFGDEHYHEWRVGGHISNLKFGKVQVDISAGYSDDSLVGTGAYSTVELSEVF
jgi:outer membrane immunogenic protein